MTAKNKYYMPFLMDIEEASRRIIEGLEKGKTRIAFPLPLQFVSYLGKLLPGYIFESIMGFWNRQLSKDRHG
jgi:hypothetical protein